MDDRTAIERCVGGDRNAFRHLVDEYQRQALGHALLILGKRADARDALQNAFLKAFQALPRFDSLRRFYPWFYVILRNCCFRIAKRRDREGPSLDCTELPVDAPAGREEAALAVRDALGHLGPKDREVIVLRHFDGLSYEELASHLEIPRGTVMSRLFNARKRLRSLLEPGRGHRPVKEES